MARRDDKNLSCCLNDRTRSANGVQRLSCDYCAGPQEWRARTAFSNASHLEKLHKTATLSRNSKRFGKREENRVLVDLLEVIGGVEVLNADQ